MIIGVPKEIKTREYRIGMVPAGVRTLVAHGHEVFVESGAGEGSGLPDEAFVAAGAKMLDTADEVWAKADMIVKVKEPLAPEYARMKKGQIVYTYFHLAAVPELAKVLLEKEIAAVAYETIQMPDGSLPLLKPMSEVAGKMATQVGAMCLEKAHGGKGVLLGGVPGTRRGKVAVLGGGIVGTNAAKIAMGMGADVTILDVNLERLTYLDEIFGDRITTLYSDPEQVYEAVTRSDLVVGAVLIAGAKAPRLVTRSMLTDMQDGAVVVDVAVDQGGCIETCRPTTHDDPTYIIDGVVHYCVANMPGAVAHTSTFALTNTTIGHAVKLADKGLEAAMRADHPLALGLNSYKGAITHRAVAESLGLPYAPIEEVLS